jgi:Uma2 family endonuclease
MSTVTEASNKAIEGEHPTVLRGIGWGGYQALLKMGGDRPVRITYDRGDAEIISPLPKLEREKSLLGQFVRLLAREFRIPIMPMGSTTWSRDLDRVRDPDHAALGTNPPPDLAIEIEMTRSVLNRLGIYGALGVPEVWRFNGLTLLVLLRQEDGSYQESLTSGIFPEVTMAEIARFAIKEGIKDENAYLDEFTNWVRAEVLPRLERRGGS